ncbi:hypothetical protein VTK56DRAFT_4576 [Thermocarpiscus australiensis]
MPTSITSLLSDTDEAINLLSLDGGGVRGVSSLLILDEIMVKIQEMHGLPEIPKPCEFFHMIAGTSTGGLIAIMLGRLRMSTKEALQEYDNCAARIFSSKNRKFSISERFRATALQEAVESIVKERDMGDEMIHPEYSFGKGKTLVCVMPSGCIGEPRFVRSYMVDSVYDWQLGSDIKIWEAARATTAASSFFKPQKLGSGPAAQTYIDAAIGVNNPVEYLLKEAVDEFGSGRRFGCVVSIGTGTKGVKLGRALTGFRNLIQAPVYYYRLIKTLKITATDGEETHRRLQSRLLPFPGAYYRFNVPEAADKIKLHHYQKIPQLKSLTAEYLARVDVARQVRQLADLLKTDGSDHGLTLGHVYGLDKDQLVLSNKKPQSMGTTSRFFTGRRDVLETLYSCFAPRNSGGRPRREFLLHGMGGVGKTEVALRLAQDLEDRFKYIFYIDGSTPASILQSYAAIARQNGLGGGTADELRTRAMRWMADLTEEWLMIFDDCRLRDRQGQLPGEGKGNIIYTSRSTELKRFLPPDCSCEVTPLGEADAIDLLLKASGAILTAKNSDDRTAAKAIVQELGCLPLAVNNAAASIRDGNLALQDYLEKLREEKVRILSGPRFRGKDVENPTVYATLELSYDAIIALRRRRGRDALGFYAAAAPKVLSLLCFYHHNGIPTAMLERAAEERHRNGSWQDCPLRNLTKPPDRSWDFLVGTNAEGVWSPGYFTGGLYVLRSFSLVKLSDDGRTISMHVLVHSWARHRMEKEIASQWNTAARVLLLESIGWSSTLPEQSFARFLGPHFEACLSDKTQDLPDEMYEAHLLEKLGWYFGIEKRFLDARDCLLKASRIYKFVGGSQSWRYIKNLTHLARLCHEMGDLSEAELFYWEAIERLEQKQKQIDDAYDARFDIVHGHSPRAASCFSKALTKHVTRGIAEGPIKVIKRPPAGLLDRASERFAKSRAKGNGLQSAGELVLPVTQPRSTDTHVALSEAELDKILRKADMSGRIILPITQEKRIETERILKHAELSKVLRDQGRWHKGRRMLFWAVEKLENQQLLDRNDPALVRHQIEVLTLTQAWDSESWRKRIDELVEAPLEVSKPIWLSGVAADLLTAWAHSALQRNPHVNWYVPYEAIRQHCENHEHAYGTCDKTVLKLSRCMIECLICGEQYDRAVTLAKDCVARARAGYGEFHMETIQAYVLLSVAVFYQKSGLEEECRGIVQEALARATIGLGQNHPQTRLIQTLLKAFEAPLPQSIQRKSEERMRAWLARAAARAAARDRELGISEASHNADPDDGNAAQVGNGELEGSRQLAATAARMVARPKAARHTATTRLALKSNTLATISEVEQCEVGDVGGTAAYGDGSILSAHAEFETTQCHPMFRVLRSLGA